MTESREMVIPYGDLTVMSVACPGCGAALVVDFANTKQRRAWTENKAVLCGVCQHPLDSGLKEAFAGFDQWITAAKKSGLSIDFRVSMTTYG
jgi:hypothetical protein